jgi:hypothetical protein
VFVGVEAGLQYETVTLSQVPPVVLVHVAACPLTATSNVAARRDEPAKRIKRRRDVVAVMLESSYSVVITG